MSNSRLPSSFSGSAGSDPDRPSGTALVLSVVAVVFGAVVIFGVILPAIFSLASLVLPVLLLVAGAGLVTGEDQEGGGFRKLVGWTALTVGGIWALNVIGIGSLLSFLFVRLPMLALLVGVGIYVGRALTKR